MAATPTATCSTCELHAEAVFRVEGMDCNEEVVILERRLKPLAGLEAVSADLIGQRLHVKYDAAKLTTSAMVDAVGQTGMRMWLEHEEPAAYGADVTRRSRLVTACAVAIGGGVAADAAGMGFAADILYVLATVVGAVSPVQRAVTAIRSRTIDINVLMVIAVAGALALGEWLEGASVVFLFSVAQWLEVRTMERARQAIHALIGLSPREAIVRRPDGEHRVAVEDVRIGDEIVLRPGDKVPLDGVVTEGLSDVNEAPLTGESLPIDKARGDEVYAGTINGHGALEVRVTRLVRDTRLSRIIHLVETAQASRAPVQSFVDRFARWYTPAVIALAVAIALVPAFSATADAATWLYRSLVLLVIACPCALVISTPVSVVSALSAAARNGVLIKGGAYLERLAAVRVVAFDKTGTLTRGELQVSDVIVLGSMSEREIISLAGAVESRSEHPIAKAIVQRAAQDRLDVGRVSAFRSIPGMGAEAEVGGRRVIVGSARMLAERQPASTADRSSSLAAFTGRGDSIVFVVVDAVLAGAIALADRPRHTARETVELLREHGIRHVAMLTGDHLDAARAVASHVGVDDCHATLTPDQKHSRVRELREAHGPVLMVGDGVNDAPALAAADVGIAMGAAGSDAALETADVALMSDELLKLPYALRLARATLRNIKTNVTISLALKAAFLVLAIMGSATLWMAVLADTGASVIVVGNALRLLRAR
jgi:Cd2+/Zn2+-exporting ATPase